MAEYDLGTARGRIELDASGVEKGAAAGAASMDKVTDSQGRASASMAKTGAVMLGGATVIAGGFAVAINAAATFETTISGIQAVSGATSDQLEVIRKKALQLGADTQYSAGEAAAAMEELIKAGLSVDDVLNGAADATVNLAAAGGVDLTTAATIASNAMNAFGLSAEQMPHVADLIAGAANASAIDVNEFGLALQQSGAVANVVGLSFDDLSVAIAAMGNAGIKGSDAGTSLKTFLTNLIPTTQKQTDLMKQLGLVTADGANQFFDASGKIKSMAEIGGTLSEALKGMTEQQKLATLQTLFGSDAIRAAAVIADTGTQGFNDLATSMGKVSAADVAKTRMDNLAGSMEQLRGSVETLLITIGRPLADALRVWIDRLTVVVNWIQSLDSNTLHIIAIVAQFVGTLLGLGGAFLIVSSSAGKLKEAITVINLAMEANPILAIITLLIALGVAFYQAYQNIQPFHDWVDRTAVSLREYLLPILETIQNGLKGFWSAFQGEGVTSNGFVGFMERAGVVARSVWDFLSNDFIPGLQAFWNALNGNGTDSSTGFSQAMSIIGTVVRDLGIAIAVLAAVVGVTLYGAFLAAKAGVEAAWEPMLHLWDWLNANLFPTFYALGELVVAVVQRIVDTINFLMPVFKLVFGVILGVVSTTVKIIENLWDRFGDNIMQVIRLAMGTVKTIIESVLSIIRGIIQVITGIISGDWSKVWEGILTIFEGIWNIIQEIPGLALDVIKLAIETAIDVVAAIFENGWLVISNGVSLAWEGIKGIVMFAIEAIIGFIADIPNRLATFVGTIFSGLTDAASSAIDGVVGFFRDLPGRLAGLAGTIAQAGVDIATSLLNGIIDGVTGFASFVGDFATGLGHALIDWVNTKIIQWINDKIPDEITMPSEIPNINLPDDPIPWIPNPFHSGGVVPGKDEVGIIAQGGEGVLSREQMGWFASVLQGLGSSIPRFFGGDIPAIAAGGLGGAGAGTSVLAPVSLVFPNVGSAKDAAEIKKALTHSEVLSSLTRSIKAGVGRNN